MVNSPRRILHLADPSWPGGGPCTLRMLSTAMRRLTHDRHVAVVLGNRADLELARRCGVAAVGNVPMPGGAAPFARRALRRVVAALEAEGGKFTLVHAWSCRSALLCDVVPSARSVTTAAVAPVEGVHAELLGAALAARPMPLLASTASVRQELLAAGIDPALVPTLPPGVDVPEPAALADAHRRLRRRWGIDGSTSVIGLLGEPVEWSDARGAAFLLTLLRVAGHRVHLVMHPRANRGDHMLRWTSPLRIDRHVTLDPIVALPWAVAPGLDVALLLGDETTALEPRPLGSPLSLLMGGRRPSRPMPGVLPLLWAAAAGVPALAEASLAACGVVEEGRTGVLVEPRHVEAAARRLLTLLEDAQTRGRLGHAARAHVAQSHPQSAMTVRIRQVYDCLAAGRPVPVPLVGMTDGDDGRVEWRPVPEASRRPAARVRIERSADGQA